jgi:hypothetical protein
MVVGERGRSSQDTVHWPQGSQASLMRDPAVRENLGDTAPAQPFSGQCALIAGGTSGIGLESAAQLGEAGVSRVSAAFSGKLFAKAKTLAHLGVTLRATNKSEKHVGPEVTEVKVMRKVEDRYLPDLFKAA